MAVKTILIIDDEESIKFLYSRMFKKQVRANEFALEFCMSGEDALEKIKEDKIDNLELIISDINMPGLSGFEVLQEVKEIKPDLPVFMSSAYSDEERQNYATELGAQEYITKPVDFEYLSKRIKDVLGT